eukprot:TRINITY_DN3768_c0_g1_i1.p1 TRINITY_DN3768_c0_g1~~TRINITY_DN3768_c0_g1_i1.p1  ORF type:complete len:188 (+),score=25.59 TRINITY_DN3768_c0_g1_i1:162-725(+)
MQAAMPQRRSAEGIDSLGLPITKWSKGWKSSPNLLNWWLVDVLYSPEVEPVMFPTVKEKPWPVGTKDTYISMEAVFRKGPGLFDFMKEPGNQIKKFAKARNAHIIGDGIVAPPPKSGLNFSFLDRSAVATARNEVRAARPENSAIRPEASAFLSQIALAFATLPRQTAPRGGQFLPTLRREALLPKS